mmetsp:Transcript_5280/g.17554  ORF Transcript_5280/g.17554 Transcript_5280/m.17554 type:complete len:283 (+) Transcript_5280:1529-2377(+)
MFARHSLKCWGASVPRAVPPSAATASPSGASPRLALQLLPPSSPGRAASPAAACGVPPSTSHSVRAWKSPSDGRTAGSPIVRFQQVAAFSSSSLIMKAVTVSPAPAACAAVASASSDQAATRATAAPACRVGTPSVAADFNASPAAFSASMQLRISSMSASISVSDMSVRGRARFITARARSTWPFSRSHRGDSGRKTKPASWIRAGTPPRPSIHRQPSGWVANEPSMMAASTWPETMQTLFRAMSLPRRAIGASSAMKRGTVPEDRPTATPTMTRPMMRVS